MNLLTLRRGQSRVAWRARPGSSDGAEHSLFAPVTSCTSRRRNPCSPLSNSITSPRSASSSCRACSAAGVTAALRAEVDTAIRDAYAATYGERVIDGISGHYLPMTSRLTPVSAGLVCDDPVLIGAAEALLGGPVLPSLPEGVLYFAEAGWHNDDGIGVAGVKYAAYFDPLDASNGALRFIPCSQYNEARVLASRLNHRVPGRSCRGGRQRAGAAVAGGRVRTGFPWLRP